MISIESATTLARSAATTNGLSLDADALSAVATRLAADLAHDGGQLAFDGAPPFRFEGGQVVDVDLVEHILDVVREHGRPVEPEHLSPEAGSTTPAQARSGNPIADLQRHWEAQHDAELFRATERMKNPWLPGQINLTNQNIIKNKNPALAAKFQREAGH